MGHQCCIPGCNTNGKHGSKVGVTFHSFPVDPVERKQWLESVKKLDVQKLSVTKHTKVCSKHFRIEDFVAQHNSKRRLLKKGVFPSIFTSVNKNAQSRKENISTPTENVPEAESSEKAKASSALPSQEDVEDFDKQKDTSSNLDNEQDNSRTTDGQESSMDVSASMDQDLKGDASCDFSGRSEDYDQGNMSDTTHTSSPSDSNMGSPSKKTGSGLSFHIGSRLEAKDLGNENWYPVKIVEVDWEDEEVLIHFEKWSQRYDEWVPMDSSRLRPNQNPVPGIESKSSAKVFKVGDKVMATWSDSRRYPAKVNSILDNDKYEVLFFDGYTKTIKGARMTKLGDSKAKVETEVPKEDLTPPVKEESKRLFTSHPTFTKEERRERKRKINVVELFHPKKRIRLGNETPNRSEPEEEKPKEVQKRRRRKLSPHKDSDVEEQSEEPLSTALNSSANKVESPPTNETSNEEDTNKKNKDAHKWKMKVKARGRRGDFGSKLRRGSSNLKQEEDLSKSKPLEHSSSGKKILNKPTNLEQETPSSATKSRRESNDSMTLETSGEGEGGEPVEEKKEATDSSAKSENKTDAPSEPAKDTDKWAADGETSVAEPGDGDRKTIVIPDSNLPLGWSKHTIQRKHGSSAGKWDVILVNSEGRKFRTRSDIKQYFEEKEECYNPDLFDFCVSGKKRLHRAPDFNIRKVPRLSGSRGRSIAEPGNESVEKPQQQVLRRVKTLLPKIRTNSGQPLTEEEPGSKLEPLSPPPPYTTTVTSVPANLEMTEPEGQVIVGGLKIQMENNTYKCPKGGCGKNFRKENLLQMHIKHYHPEYNKFMGSTPNVADLAYARTIGESIEDLMPKPRFSGGSSASVTTTPFAEKANRMEPLRKIKTAGGISGGSSNSSSNMNALDTTFLSEKKKPEPKDKQPSTAIPKKTAKRSLHENENRMLGEESVSTSEEPQEENSSITDTIEVVASATSEMPILHKEEKKEPHTIKILMPVVRSPPQETSPAERTKAKAPVEEGEEYVEVMDVGPRQASSSHPTTSAVHAAAQLPNLPITSTPAVTKSLRPVKKRYLSDFHFEPIHKRRKIATKLDVSDEIDVTDEGEASVDITSTSVSTTATKTTPTTYRYSKKKTPVVHLEKLNIVTDSNGRVILSSMKVQGQRKLNKNTEQPGFEQLRKEELINCTCGFMEEDGLMIQCDLCLCWQHGICNNIEKETEVPEKYVCPICLNPFRQRKSKKYLHDQDWLKEGKLPSLSFRSKNETTIAEREAILKRSHDLTGSLLQIQQVLHSLRVKVNIAGIPDHPKLYLWAKSWEKDNGSSSSRLPGATESENRPSCSQLELEKQKPVIVESCNPEILNSKIKSNTEHIEAKLQTEEDKDEQLTSVTSLEPNRTDKEVENEDFVTVANISDVGDPFVAADAEEARNELLSCQNFTGEQADSSLSAEGKTNAETNEKESPQMNTHADGKDEPNLSSLDSTEKTLHNKEKMEPLKCSEEIAVSMEEEVLAQEEKECNLSEQVLNISSNSSEQNVQKNETEAAPSEKSEATENNSNVSKTIETEETEEATQKPSEEMNYSSEEQVNPIETDKAHEEEDKVDKQDKTLNKEHDDLSNQAENHGLLHQALTSSSQIGNSLTNGVTGSNLDGTSGHSMLQLPICQSELMQFASTMADNLDVTDTPRPPINEAPRIPQPEAPIDPVECRLFLLDHIDHFQAQIDTRLTMLEEQVAALESQDPESATDEAPDYFPQTKQTVQMLLRDLLTMRRIAALN